MTTTDRFWVTQAFPPEGAPHSVLVVLPEPATEAIALRAARALIAMKAEPAAVATAKPANPADRADASSILCAPTPAQFAEYVKAEEERADDPRRAYLDDEAFAQYVADAAAIDQPE